jgi:hypothetical protein
MQLNPFNSITFSHQLHQPLQVRLHEAAAAVRFQHSRKIAARFLLNFSGHL